MKIGFIGLGKLGLPCAVAAALKGHDVMGYDRVPALMNKAPRGYRETGPDGVAPFNPYLACATLRFGTLDEVVDHAELLFVAVQTPHDPRYEGTTRLPEERKDFDYAHVIAAIRDISAAVRRPTTVAIISTMLPGTVRRHLLPVASPLLKICYTPSFIAMGTTMRDYLHPEFVLIGVHDGDAADRIARYFATITEAPQVRTTVENAELTKVAYNTFIGMKIAFANTVMEICHKLPGADAGAVMDILKMARTRLISPTYLDGGMGDGGGCHPRDNIAMSWLARELALSHDLFDDIMRARENQTVWLADLMCDHALPKAILGYSYKPETNIAVGSPALLLRSILEERGHDVRMHDPHIDPAADIAAWPAHVFLIGARHRDFERTTFPPGSIVIDPWRYIPANQRGVTVIPVGIGRPAAPV